MLAVGLLRRQLNTAHRLSGITRPIFRNYAVSTPAPGKRTAVYHDRLKTGLDEPEEVPPEAMLAETGVNRKDVEVRHFTGEYVCLW